MAWVERSSCLWTVASIPRLDTWVVLRITGTRQGWGMLIFGATTAQRRWSFWVVSDCLYFNTAISHQTKGETGKGGNVCQNSSYLSEECRFGTYQYNAEAIKIIASHDFTKDSLFIYLAYGTNRGTTQSCIQKSSVAVSYDIFYIDHVQHQVYWGWTFWYIFSDSSIVMVVVTIMYIL